MAEVEALTTKLNEDIQALEAKFLKAWIPAQPEHEPEDFEHDIKAYCVLAHAIFEDFSESISLIGMKASTDAWLTNKPIRGTFTLLHSYGFQFDIPDKEEIEQIPIFDQIRTGLNDAKSKHSIALSNNHGFSLKYLRKILTPIGIDVPNELKLMGSLRELADARGSYAHTRANKALYGEWRKAIRPMTPESAKNAVNDCLELCMKLSKKLMEMMAPPATILRPVAPQGVKPRIKLPR